MKIHFNLTQNEKICWLWNLIGLSISFSPLLFNFIWGNHDWMPLLTDNRLRAGLIEGRFTQYFFLNIFLAGKILPILNILFGFITYTLAITLLCSRFFKFNIQSSQNILGIMVVSTLPYIIEILYFHFITFSLLCWPLIIVMSLLATKKSIKKNHILNIIISSFLLFTAIGGYPASAGLYATAAILYIMLTLPKFSNLKQLILNITPFAITFICAFLPIPFIYSWLKKENLMLSLYNTETETLTSLIFKIPTTLCHSLQSLLQAQPFFSEEFKILTTFIVILFTIIYLHNSRSQRQTSLSLALIVILFLTLKLPAWLTRETPNSYFAPYDPVAFMVRTDFYTMPCLILFSIFYLSQTSKIWLKNIIFTLSTILLWLNLNANLTFTKTHLFGFTAENLLLQRITDRFQENKNFIPHQIYHITQIGDIPLRNKYYIPNSNEKYGYYTLQVPYTRYWVASEYYNFYAPQYFAANSTPLAPSSEMIKYITTQITPWPSINSIFLDKEDALIALSPEILQTFMIQLNHYQRSH